jgi:signal transduction histidine kinase
VTTTGRLRGAPIGLQLIALLLASLAAAQVISFGVILLMPAPRPSVFRVSELATALRGGSLAPRFGRPLVRQQATQLPADFRTARPERGRATRALAADLGVPETRVRLVQEGSTLQRWLFSRLLGRPEPSRDQSGRGPDGPGGGPLDRAEPPGAAGYAQGWPQRSGGNGGFYGRFPAPGDAPVFDRPAAALQLDNGAWTVVRASPEPFPTEWQIRFGLWLLAGLAVVAPAGYLFARRITAPLKRFGEAAERLGRDPHAPEMTLSGPAEVGAAAQAFNEMQTRLKRYIGDRTAMVGAISHDLRTPLARIRFKVEDAPPKLRDSVLADVAQMEQMIGGVLAFIRDEGAPRRREKLDLLSLLECVADDAATLGGDVEIVEGAPVTVDGDAVSLQRLFGNLVDNAVKYGGEARISLKRMDGVAVVEIADRGPGLADKDLEKVFQPFYRADASRNLDSGGVGLGLPIARSAARAHGGDLELSAREQGLAAIVTLPAA